MEDLTIILLAVICATVIWLAAREIRQFATTKYRFHHEKTSAARAARSHPGEREETEAGVGAWLPELLENFGVDPDIIFEDEMPEELATLLPFVKSFVKSGGLDKLLKGGGSPPTDQGEGGFVENI